MKLVRLSLCVALIMATTNYSAFGVTKVAYVYDGDTLTMADGNKVRLVQIDTPEISPAECYGKESRDLLKKLVGVSGITLTKEPIAGNRDSFGRLLRYVNISSMNVNLELVKRGAATPWFYKGQKGKFSEELLKAALTAQKKKIGLWKACPATVLDPSKGVDTGPVQSNLTDNNDVGKDIDELITVTPGAYCSESDAGKIGLSAKGIEYKCKVSNSEQRLRWRR